jgi:hypothetical protein
MDSPDNPKGSTPHLAERFNYGNLEPELAIRAERAPIGYVTASRTR